MKFTIWYLSRQGQEFWVSGILGQSPMASRQYTLLLPATGDWQLATK